MAVICADCKTGTKSGRIFYQCSACGRWWCSKCGHEGKKCICGKGFLKK